MRSRAARGVGSLVHGRNAAKAHVLANRPKYGIAAKGTRTASNAASRAMDLAIAKRQTQVGRRVIAGGVGLGAVGMGRNRDGSRGGFRGPQGSGRYA